VQRPSAPHFAVHLAIALAILIGCSSDSAAPSQPAAKIQVTITPSGLLRVNVGTVRLFTATLTNDTRNAGVDWSLTGSGCTGTACGTLAVLNDSTVSFTAPAVAPAPATVTLTATSITDHSKSASDAVEITAPGVVSVVISAAPGSVYTSQQAQVTATVFGDSANAGVTWTVTGAGCTGAACGTIFAGISGSRVPVTYTAPGTVPTPATINVTATSVADPTKSATVVINLALSIQVSLTPTGVVGANVGTSREFTATVSNDPGNAGVTWSVIGCSGACGTLSATHSASGAPVSYTAPASVPAPNFLEVRATAIADTTRIAGVIVVVTTPGVITVDAFPAYVRLCKGTVPSWMCPAGHFRSAQLTGYVFNDPSGAGVTWWSSGSSVWVTPSTSASGVPVNVSARLISTTAFVTARSIADSTKSGTATVQVCNPTRSSPC
jgi:hypothetical protein